jgi:outer membrane protein insertion porin family
MIVLKRLNKLILTAIFLLSGVTFAQERMEIYDYSLRADDYVIGGITVTGVRFLDPNALIGISGLRVGQRISIPGDALNIATQKLWQQGLFSDIRFSITGRSRDSIFLDIEFQERPRISSVRFDGLKRSESKDLVEKVNLPVGSQVTPYLLNTARRIIVDHFVEKGFLNTEVHFIQKDDFDQPNGVILTVEVDKKEKVKISEIRFVGNEYFKASKLRRKMKGTKVKNLNFFRASKFVDNKFEDDKQNLITFYNDDGFKDFTIVSDSIYITEKNRLRIIPWNRKNEPDSPQSVTNRIGLTIRVDEGNQYFLRNVEWVGNSVYRKEDLERVFNIKKGSVYNQSLINDRLNGTSGAPDAVSSLYQDHGYLFSRLTPVEAKVENDSVDLEIRIYEGDQAYLNDIIISGNTRTNEHVAR